MLKIGDSCIVTNVLKGTSKGPLPNGKVNPLYKEMLGDMVTVLSYEPASGCVTVSNKDGYRRTVFPWRLSLNNIVEANE